MVMEFAVELARGGVFSEESQLGATDLLIGEQRGQFEVLRPEARALGDEQGIDDIGQHFLNA